MQEKLYQWILRQQEEGSRVAPVDIVTYLQVSYFFLTTYPAPARILYDDLSVETFCVLDIDTSDVHTYVYARLPGTRIVQLALEPFLYVSIKNLNTRRHSFAKSIHYGSSR